VARFFFASFIWNTKYQLSDKLDGPFRCRVERSSLADKNVNAAAAFFQYDDLRDFDPTRLTSGIMYTKIACTGDTPPLRLT
jgi:hypothetical protein